MTEKRITIATADEQIRRLYETAFPEDEQIPWDDLIRLVEEMPLDFTARRALVYADFFPICLLGHTLQFDKSKGLGLWTLAPQELCRKMIPQLYKADMIYKFIGSKL